MLPIGPISAAAVCHKIFRCTLLAEIVSDDGYRQDSGRHPEETCMKLSCRQVFLRVGYLHSLCKDEAVMQSAEMGPMGSIDYAP